MKNRVLWQAVYILFSKPFPLLKWLFKEKVNYEDIIKVFRSFREYPIITSGIVILLVILFLFGAYFTGFLGEKGRQQATSLETVNDKPKDIPKIEQQTKSSQTPDKDKIKIDQHTEGDQSPAIVSDEVNIKYGTPKDKKKKD